jgi:hypothetical protein
MRKILLPLLAFCAVTVSGCVKYTLVPGEVLSVDSSTKPGFCLLRYKTKNSPEARTVLFEKGYGAGFEKCTLLRPADVITVKSYASGALNPALSD